jgi:hypothetical protein
MKPDKKGNFRLGNPKGFTESMQKKAVEVYQRAS